MFLPIWCHNHNISFPFPLLPHDPNVILMPVFKEKSFLSIIILVPVWWWFLAGIVILLRYSFLLIIRTYDLLLLSHSYFFSPLLSLPSFTIELGNAWRKYTFVLFMTMSFPLPFWLPQRFSCYACTSKRMRRRERHTAVQRSCRSSSWRIVENKKRKRRQTMISTWWSSLSLISLLSSSVSFCVGYSILNTSWFTSNHWCLQLISLLFFNSLLLYLIIIFCFFFHHKRFVQGVLWESHKKNMLPWTCYHQYHHQQQHQHDCHRCTLWVYLSETKHAAAFWRERTTIWINCRHAIIIIVRDSWRATTSSWKCRYDGTQVAAASW